MTNDERMKNPETAFLHGMRQIAAQDSLDDQKSVALPLSFVFRHSFDIRHSCFVIVHFITH